jgi:DNA-directed RNA polymerase subunit RPC12/RpoP
MSNEYKDWEKDKIEEEQRIVTKYPFLRTRGIDGTIDTEAKFPLVYLEIPKGWFRLFFQMCDDIKPLLEEEGVLNDFYFIHVKEKYNRLMCYHSGVLTKEVQDIIDKYSIMASYICTNCGKPATYETQSYLTSYCDDCMKSLTVRERIVSLEFKPYYKVIGFSKGGHYEKTISFEEEWNRYIKENGYED